MILYKEEGGCLHKSQILSYLQYLQSKFLESNGFLKNVTAPFKTFVKEISISNEI